MTLLLALHLAELRTMWEPVAYLAVIAFSVGVFVRLGWLLVDVTLGRLVRRRQPAPEWWAAESRPRLVERRGR